MSNVITKGYRKDKYGNVRCTLCNKVSQGEIADENADYSPNAFYYQPNGIDVHCSTCNSEINDVRMNWMLEDE